jgi:hypothetical protein
MGFFAGFILLTGSQALAQPTVNVTLAWEVGDSTDSVGYNVYYGTSSGVYTELVSVGNATQATLSNLLVGTTYYIAVTALDNAGLESGYSDEIEFMPAPNAPSLLPGSPATNGFVLKGLAAVGHDYDVLASQDLRTWRAIGSVTPGPDGSFTFIDPAAPRYASRFYKLHETTYASGTLPNLAVQPSTNGSCGLQVTGLAGHVYDIMASQDLQTWTVIGTVPAGPGGLCNFVDPVAGRYSSRFYRLHDVTYTPEGTLPQIHFDPAAVGIGTLQLKGEVGHRYDVLASTDLNVWTAIGTITAGPDGLAGFLDPYAGRYPARFYRLHEITYTLEGSLPTVDVVPLTDGGARLRLKGQVGHRYDILHSEDLSSWAVLTSVLIGAGGTSEFVDQTPGPQYYRLRESPPHR